MKFTSKCLIPSGVHVKKLTKTTQLVCCLLLSRHLLPTIPTILVTSMEVKGSPFKYHFISILYLPRLLASILTAMMPNKLVIACQICDSEPQTCTKRTKNIISCIELVLGSFLFVVICRYGPCTTS